MKKFMTMMLGLSLVLGTASVAFSQEQPAPKKEKKVKKSKKEKKEAEKK
jgi:hypothetical protein